MSDWFSIYLIAPVVAWLAAQVIKTAIALSKNEHMGLYREFLGSGGMPSSHSSITIALLVVVGARAGVDSAIFGLAFVMTSVILYDALNVRRAVGEQGEVLKGITDKKFYTSKGHRPMEVLAGSVLGVLVAVGMLQIL